MKTCTKCKETKELNEYHFSNKECSILRNICKACAREQRHAWYLRNSKRHKDYNIQWRKNKRLKEWGITQDECNEILKKQEYSCAICKIEFSKLKTKYHHDHNHKTNKFRGFLCSHCNRAIGLLKEDIKALANAIEYLK